MDRGHLIAAQFGGHGGRSNIVAMFSQFNNNARNNPGMATGEDAVRRLMPPDCAPVEVDVEVAYHDEPAVELWALEPHALPVSLVHYQAVSPMGVFNAVMEHRYYS